MPIFGQTSDIQAWLSTPRAKLLLQRERHQLGAVLPHVFGYRLLQLGDWPLGRELLATSATLCQWRACRSMARHPDIVFDGESLPLRSASLDAVVLPHALETATSPHRLLREVDRVLCDRGQLVVLGFNPFSTWAVRGRLAGRLAGRRLYSLGRVCDWLELLDYELVSATRFGLGFPWLPAAGVDVAHAGLWGLPALLGQAYVMVARKRVMASTACRPAWRKPPLPARTLPEPSACGGHRHAA